jgi:CRISPR-associated endonuclease Cas1
MNSDDTLYGRIKNRVLTISGNNASIRIDGGSLVVSDGPVPVAADHKGPALPAKERMMTGRFRRADCPVDRIVVTRPDGFITFGAIKWLHGVGVSLVQLDWDGTVLLATAPAGNNLPALRRAQALAAGTDIGHVITRELLHAKLGGQAAVARLLDSAETAQLILNLSGELDSAPDAVRLLAIEAMAAAAYWPLWHALPLHFVRRDQTPEHWRTFGGRHSPLSGKPLKAASPGNAIINYLYGVLAGEMTIAITAAGLDPGMGIFHTDRDRRASLAYDALETIRPYVDGWLIAWLATTRFSKRDFYEEADGAIRLTRPLTSHLAMTAAIWRQAAQVVAAWLARALTESIGGEHSLPAPMPTLTVPKRRWQGLEPRIVKTCVECGMALAPRQRKFCSEVCTVSFHVAMTEPGKPAPVGPIPWEPASIETGSEHGMSAKNRRHLALRRAWDAEHPPSETAARAAKAHGRNTWAMPADKQLREWFSSVLAPRLVETDWRDIQRATGLSKRYAFMVKAGYIQHPRHYPSLTELVGVTPPQQTSR